MMALRPMVGEKGMPIEEHLVRSWTASEVKADSRRGREGISRPEQKRRMASIMASREERVGQRWVAMRMYILRSDSDGRLARV